MLKAYRYKTGGPTSPNAMHWPALSMLGRELYNDCLYQRKVTANQSLRNSPNNSPNSRPSSPVYKNVYSQVLQKRSGSIGQGIQEFSCVQVFGFPRFKGANRIDSFTYPQGGILFRRAVDSVWPRLAMSKYGLSRAHCHAGQWVKTCTIKRSVHGWFCNPYL